MHYIPDPKIFAPQEIFPPWIIKENTDGNGNIKEQIWRLMDSRILWTAVQLRKEFGTMIINDYLWGGDNDERGYRDFTRLIDTEHFNKTGIIRASWSSFTSQHCFGRALDSTFKNNLVDEVRTYIITHKDKEEFRYITAIEKEVPWLHTDVRNFQIADERFFLF